MFEVKIFFYSMILLEAISPHHNNTNNKLEKYIFTSMTLMMEVNRSVKREEYYGKEIDIRSAL